MVAFDPTYAELVARQEVQMLPSRPAKNVEKFKDSLKEVKKWTGYQL